MSAIFGILRRDGVPVIPASPETMRSAMSNWGPDGSDIWLSGPAAMGQMLLACLPEARYERISCIDGVVYIVAGRIDNRNELIDGCRLRMSEHERSEIPDAALVIHAYRKWGEDCPNRIYGDWAFAAYHQKERRLFLARDHSGNTSVYYYADSKVFAFASSRNALLALGLAPMEMDELYLAQVVISWPAYHGERTIHTPIKRLPPAHCLTVMPDWLNVKQYWRLEDTPELRLPKREDYADAFGDVFNEAVRYRLRAVNGIGVTLSGGLDSGSVAATAAHFLQGKGKPLLAFTSVPLSNPGVYVGKRFGDEFPYAQATAQYAGISDLFPITAISITPIQAIRTLLAIHNEPSHAAGNFFWIQGILEAARKRGCRVLFTGQAGNAGISWEGDVFSQSLGFQLSHLGWQRWSQEMVKRYTPAFLLNAYRNMRQPKNGWWKSSAIHPDFANRLNLRACLLSASDSLLSPKPRNPREQRCVAFMHGRSIGGALWAETGASYSMEVRDPTADARVLAFTFSVPDHIFIDPKTGVNRWLIREAMKGRLPDEVRLNRKRGLQAADLVLRLRACAGEVDTALDELACGPADAYVNVPYMRDVWQIIRAEDTLEARRKAATILTRGIMAGLWVNDFYHNTK